jgi:hypothetical protein
VYGRINCREQITWRSTFVWENKLQGTYHLEIYMCMGEYCREQITWRSTCVWENKLQGTDHVEIYKLIAE